ELRAPNRITCHRQARILLHAHLVPFFPAPLFRRALLGWEKARGPARGPVLSGLTAGGGYWLVVVGEVVVLQADGFAASGLAERVVGDFLVGGRGRIDR